MVAGVGVMLLLLAPTIVALIASRRRRRGNALATLLATLALASTALWLHAQDRFGDELYFDGASRQVWLSSHAGSFLLTVIRDWSPRAQRAPFEPRGGWLTEPAPPAAGAADMTALAEIPRGLCYGIIPATLSLWDKDPRATTRPATRPVAREHDWLLATLVTGTQRDWGRDIAFPYWRFDMRWGWIVTLLSIYPVVRVTDATIHALRARRRRRRGCCVGCGYDLRESRGVCPECGLALTV
jgi:hypothetical protein